MRTPLAALFLFPFLLHAAGAVAAPDDAVPVGNVENGKLLWRNARPGNTTYCRICHGDNAEGGFGVDLAGGRISWERVRRYVRQPLGVMPAFTEHQLSDQKLADIYAYLKTLPEPKELAAWRNPAPPPDAPRRQYLLVTNGCGQCHQPELRDPRMVLGGEAADVDFAYFAKRVYTHTDVYPEGAMGNFSRMRLPEEILREIFAFIKDDLGLLVPIEARVEQGERRGANWLYTLTLENQGTKGKGLTAEELTITLLVPPGATVVEGKGTGYQGVRKDAQGADTAVWQAPRIGPGEEQTYSVTLTGPGAAAPGIFKGSTVRWAKPEMRKGVPDLKLRDARMPGKEAQTAVIPPPPPK